LRGNGREKRYVSLDIKEQAYQQLLRVKTGISQEVGRTAFFSDVIELLVEAWKLLPDEDRQEILENYRRRRLGKGEGVPLPREAPVPQ